MEKRMRKVSLRRCGGNASAGAKRYSIELPASWIKSMGVTPEDRSLELSFNGSEIAIRKHPGDQEAFVPDGAIVANSDMKIKREKQNGF